MTKKIRTSHESSEDKRSEGHGHLDTAPVDLNDEDNQLRVRAVAEAQLALISSLCRLIADDWRNGAF